MRVLLVYPQPDIAPFYLQAPVGVLYVAAALSEQHEVAIYDAGIDERPLESVVSSFAPDAIGVSFTTGCVKTSFRLARQFAGHGRILIAGGSHPTYRPAECIEAGFDLVARGEVEDTLPDLLASLRPGIPAAGCIGTPPPGYFLKRGDGTYLDTGIARCADIERFTPARHLMPDEYRRRYTHGLLMGSRGCRYACSFCAAGHNGYRKRNPKKVVDELEYIVGHEGHEVVHFADDIFTEDPEWVRGICDEIGARTIRCRWSVNSRVDIPPRHWDMFDAMSRAGCEYVLLGVESGFQESLRAVGKGSAFDTSRRLVERIRTSGIRMRCNLMVGLPGATYEEHLRSIDLMETLLPNQITVSVCTPYPGTRMDRDPGRYGIRFKSADWTDQFQRDYIGVDVGRFAELIEYRHISAEEIFRFVETILQRLKPFGYVSVSEAHDSGDRVIKTYLDRPKLRPTEVHRQRPGGRLEP